MLNKVLNTPLEKNENSNNKNNTSVFNIKALLFIFLFKVGIKFSKKISSIISPLIRSLVEKTGNYQNYSH